VRRGIALLLALIGMSLAAPAQAAPVLVTLPEGSYRAIAPADWDGRKPLPLVVYLHGWREDSAQVLGNEALVAAALGLGMLFVAPDGVDQSWSHVGAPSHKRDDLAFLHAVIADAERRWPIDKRRLFAAGFSVGGSMVWDLACHDAQGIAAFLPFSGDFWTPYPARCETGPVALRHTHAVNDHTFPMEGRTLPIFSGRFHQGELKTSFAILEAADGCAAEPDARAPDGDLDCSRWTRCGGGKELELCLHHGDHQIQPNWLHRSLLWAMQRVAER